MDTLSDLNSQYYPDTGSSIIDGKRKRAPWDYRDYFASPSAPKRRRKEVADYTKSSAQQQQIYEQNRKFSPLLCLPAEIRNEIYNYVLSDKVIHISVRQCSEGEPGAWSYTDYYHGREGCSSRKLDDHSFLKFTHTLCVQPYDEEDSAHEVSTHRSSGYELPIIRNKSSYWDRHALCYRAINQQKTNWTRVGFPGKQVVISPDYKVPTHPGLAVAFLQTCRQLYTEARDLIYTSNTFAFREGYTLALFLCNALNSQQKKLISSIQADGWNNKSHEPGLSVRPATLSSLPNLERLLVVVNNAHSNQDGFVRHPGRRASSVNRLLLTPDAIVSAERLQVVKVTVDRVEKGWYDVRELESLIRKHAEVVLGLRQ